MLKDGCYFRILVRKEDKIVGEPKKSILMSVFQNIEEVVLVVWDTVDQPVFVIYAEESKMIVLKLFLLDILLFCFYIYTASV